MTTKRVVPGTTPYAWPWDGLLTPRRLALLVIAPRWGGDLAGTPQRARVATLSVAVQAAGGRIFRVNTVPPVRPGVGPDRARGEGAEVPPTGVPEPVDLVPAVEVDAAGIDGFYGSSLDARLRAAGADQLLLVGSGLETSVHSTMRSANDRGYECLLVLDACVPHLPDLVGAARSQIEMSGGIFGAVGATDDVLAALAALLTHSDVKEGVRR